MHPAHDGGTLRYLRFIAANVRALRRRAGWTQEQLAEAADLDLRFLQRIERGATNLSILVLVAIAEAFGEPPEHLLRPATLAPSRPGRPRSALTVKPAAKQASKRARKKADDDDTDDAPPSTVRPKQPRGHGKRS